MPDDFGSGHGARGSLVDKPDVWVEAPNVRLEASKRARTVARLKILLNSESVKKQPEGKKVRKQRFTLAEYRKKHARVLAELMNCRNASETARRTGLSPTRIIQIMRRSGLRFVRALEAPSGKLRES
jgi:hypothetical protein